MATPLKRTGTNHPLFVVAAPTCNRCHRADRRGLGNVRGLALCGLCELMAKARYRLGAVA